MDGSEIREVRDLDQISETVHRAQDALVGHVVGSDNGLRDHDGWDAGIEQVEHRRRDAAVRFDPADDNTVGAADRIPDGLTPVGRVGLLVGRRQVPDTWHEL